MYMWLSGKQSYQHTDTSRWNRHLQQKNIRSKEDYLDDKCYLVNSNRSDADDISIAWLRLVTPVH